MFYLAFNLIVLTAIFHLCFELSELGNSKIREVNGKTHLVVIARLLVLGCTTAEYCNTNVEAAVICSPVEGDQDYLQV